jgi:plastocyanin
MKKIAALMAMMVLAVVALAACGSSSNSSSSTSSSSSKSGTKSASAGGGYSAVSGTSTKTTAAAASSSSGVIKMNMVDDAFQPKAITGKAGSTVKVVMKNTGAREHNFKIDSQKADADVEPGKSATVTVKIPTSGTVQFYCEYHKGLGMVGTLKAS